MGCVTDSNSIDLSVSGGVLEADLILDPSAQNLLSVSAAGVLASSLGGWIGMGATLAFSSAASPTFVATTSVNLTGLIPVGAKVSLVQSSVTLYFIVTAISSTTITLYGGTAYTLANTTITSPQFSYMGNPLGFPRDPAGWTFTFTDSTQRSQSSPSSGTWYNPGSISVSLPIGAWAASYQAVVYGQGSSSNSINAFSTLSTSASSESDNKWTTYTDLDATGVSNEIVATVNRSGSLTVAAATSYFFNVKATDSQTAVGYVNNVVPLLFKAVCAYL